MAKKYLREIAGVIGVSLLLCACLSSSSSAAGSWTDPFISTTTQTSYEERDQSLSPAYEYVHINTDKFTRYRMHVVKGVDVSLAYYTDGYQNHWFVKFTYQQYYAAITNTSQGQILNLVSGTNTLVVDKPYGANYGEPGLITSLDIRSVLKPVFSGGEISYVLDLTTAKRWFSYTTAWGEIKQKDANDWVVSSDGRYMLASMSGGYYKIDLSTQKIEDLGRHGDLQPNSFALAISNGGKYVFVSGPEFIDTTSCSIPVTEDQVVQRYPYSETATCPSVSLRQAVSNKVGYTGYDGRYRWVDNDLGIEFFVQSRRFPDGSDLPLTKVTLRQIEKTQDDSQLDYLALGDSYSSGEGDIEEDDGVTHYTPVTDYKGGCHLSDRSYPFLLGNYYGISSTLMESVACSGAKITPDYNSPRGGYYGQDSRLYLRDDLQVNQDNALQKFIPGYIPQLEFVKKYKPRAITLTGGGNDVGFAKKLISCASDSSTCDYVINPKLKLQHANEIKDMFGVFTNLYNLLKSASPNTKIYVVGYPKFINDTEDRPCFFDAGHLNHDEKVFINQSVEYLNEVIRQAARASGVVYLDVQDSLEGGQICDGVVNSSKYVTGIRDIGYTNEDDRDQTFHPNAVGHEQIAGSIIDQLWGYNLEDYPYPGSGDDSITAPTVPAYFGDIADLSLAKMRYSDDVTDKTLTIAQAFEITAPIFTFLPSSYVEATLHSTPINLATIATDANGGLSHNITVPEGITPGYHRIELSGRAYSGELITLYQIVLIQSSNLNDRDGDGILDNVDQCIFIAGNDTEGNFCSQPATARLGGDDRVSGGKQAQQGDNPLAALNNIVSESSEVNLFSSEMKSNQDQLPQNFTSTDGRKLGDEKNFENQVRISNLMVGAVVSIILVTGIITIRRKVKHE